MYKLTTSTCRIIFLLFWITLCHGQNADISAPNVLKMDHIRVGLQAGTFRYAAYYENNMVLQRSPHQANIWGYAAANDAGSTVTLTVSKASQSFSFSGVVKPGFTAGSGVWMVTLDEFNDPGPFVITASLKTYPPIILQNVLFGDVWVCSGQSNMKFTMSQIINSTQEIADGANYPSVRFFSVGQVVSATPFYDLTNVEIHWSIPTTATLPPLSAVCFLYGKYLYQTLGVPIGLVESSWGGTSVEWWSSPDALRECGLANSGIPPSAISKVPWDSNNIPDTFEKLNGYISNSDLWNAMIHPLLNMSIYGVIWYQGENNSPETMNRDKYNCTFPAMIHDWRNKWFDGSQGQTGPIFPFGFVQLGPATGAPTIAGYSNIRWHQTVDIGYAPNNKLINTFMCVAIDLFDPVGGVHFRDKITVAKRLALSGLAIAYDKTGFRFQGPIPSVLILDTAANTLDIIYDNGKYSLMLKNAAGFELCCRPDQVWCDVDAGSPVWTAMPAKQVDNSTVSVSVKACNGKNIMGLRYLWRETPCPYKQASIYAIEGNLPAGPFLYQGYMGYYSASAVKYTRHHFYIKH